MSKRARQGEESGRSSGLRDYALFLDFDGTLVDIHTTPTCISTPRDLASLLQGLTARVDGALAILTGRAIADVDYYLAPMALITAGAHGAEIRASPGGLIEHRVEPVDERIVAAVRNLALKSPGIIVELKTSSIAVHYRQVPFSAPRIEEALRRILETGPDHLVLCRGRKVLEIMPKHVSKGAALETLMRLPVFHSRRPIMIGDDVSDISAFEAAVRLGGLGLKVAGEQFAAAEADFASPAAVRTWLAEQAGAPR